MEHITPDNHHLATVKQEPSEAVMNTAGYIQIKKEVMDEHYDELRVKEEPEDIYERENDVARILSGQVDETSEPDNPMNGVNNIKKEVTDDESEKVRIKVEPEDRESYGGIEDAAEGVSKVEESVNSMWAWQGSDKTDTFCKTCKEDFFTPGALAWHFSLKHSMLEHPVTVLAKRPPVEFPCNHCQQTFPTRTSLTCHLRTRHGLHGCDSCGLSFKTRMELMAHVVKSGHADGRKRTGKNLTPFPCQHCNKSFANRDNLSAHLRTHLPYGCDVCGLSFGTVYQLRGHAVVHQVSSGRADDDDDEEESYECFMCDLTFSQQSDYLKHEKIHEL